MISGVDWNGLPAVNSDGSDTRLLDPLDKSDRLLHLKPVNDRKPVNKMKPVNDRKPVNKMKPVNDRKPNFVQTVKINHVYFMSYRRKDSDFTRDRDGNSCDQLLEDLGEENIFSKWTESCSDLVSLSILRDTLRNLEVWSLRWQLEVNGAEKNDEAFVLS